MKQYDEFLDSYQRMREPLALKDRKNFAAKAFAVSSHYDTAIFKYLNQEAGEIEFRESFDQVRP